MMDEGGALSATTDKKNGAPWHAALLSGIPSVVENGIISPTRMAEVTGWPAASGIRQTGILKTSATCQQGPVALRCLQKSTSIAIPF